MFECMSICSPRAFICQHVMDATLGLKSDVAFTAHAEDCDTPSTGKLPYKLHLAVAQGNPEGVSILVPGA